MRRIAANALRWVRASVAFSLPGGYYVTGLYCLLLQFNWLATTIVGVLHLIILAAAQRDAQPDYKPILSFVYFVFLGVLIFVVVWITWRFDISPFPLALVGSVAWSIASWTWTAYIFYIRAQIGGLETAFRSITKRDQFLVLTAPMIIGGILGVVHAATGDALVLRERVADFFHVAVVGAACGLFLGLPWLCLPFALRFWEVTRVGDHRKT